MSLPSQGPRPWPTRNQPRSRQLSAVPDQSRRLRAGRELHRRCAEGERSYHRHVAGAGGAVNDGEQRQVDLVGMTTIDASTMSRLVSRLVQHRARHAQPLGEEQPRGGGGVVGQGPRAGAAARSRSRVKLEATASAGLSAKELAVVKRRCRATSYGNLRRAYALNGQRLRTARSVITVEIREIVNESARSQCAARQGSARLARHGPAGARRRLRPAGLCAEPRPGAQAQRSSTATGCGRGSAQPKRLAYGPKPIEKLDLFATSRVQRADQRLHPRRRLAARTARTTPSWRRCTCAPARIGRARLQRRREAPTATCCRWPIRCAARSPGSTRTPRASAAIPTAFYVSGQSSGAHLGGCVVTTDWKRYGVPAGHREGRAAAARGMYDLKPVRLSKRSDYVEFTDEMRGEADLAAPSRPAQLPGDRRLRHLRDAGVPAPEPRVRRGGEGGRQAGHATGGRGLQPLRDRRDDRQSLGLLGSAVLEQMKLA